MLDVETVEMSDRRHEEDDGGCRRQEVTRVKVMKNQRFREGRRGDQTNNRHVDK